MNTIKKEIGMLMFNPKLLTVLCFTLIVSCKPQEKSSLDASTTVNGINLANRLSPRLSDRNHQISLRNIATAMGYGWATGCPGEFEQWQEVEHEETATATKTIDYVDLKPETCPQGQPALKLTFGYYVVTNGVKEKEPGNSKITIDKDGIDVTNPYKCGANTADCSITRLITESTKSENIVVNEVVNTNDTGGGFSVAVKATGKIPGVYTNQGEISTEVNFKTSFSRKESTTLNNNSEVKTQYEMECPLKRKEGDKSEYLGTIKRYPTKITTEYVGTVTLKPYVILSGFPRAQDGGGNHWMDHPTNRPIRKLRFGNDVTSYIDDLRNKFDNGLLVKDQNDNVDFGFKDLKGNAQHKKIFEDSLAYLERQRDTWTEEGKYFTAQGLSRNVQTMDTLVCEWTKVNNGETTKTPVTKRRK
jgi:hypothetical protein